MPSNDYFVPADLDALRRESELLTLENAFLKGRISALEQELTDLRKRRPAPPSKPKPAAPPQRRRAPETT